MQDYKWQTINARSLTACYAAADTRPFPLRGQCHCTAVIIARPLPLCGHLLCAAAPSLGYCHCAAICHCLGKAIAIARILPCPSSHHCAAIAIARPSPSHGHCHCEAIVIVRPSPRCGHRHAEAFPIARPSMLRFSDRNGNFSCLDPELPFGIPEKRQIKKKIQKEKRKKMTFGNTDLLAFFHFFGASGFPSSTCRNTVQ